MENWGKRAAVLIAFSLVLGIVLILIKGIGPGERPAPSAAKPEKLDISTAEPPASDERKAPPTRSPSTAPAARIGLPAPAPTGPGAVPAPPPTSAMPADLAEKLRGQAARESAFRSLFSSNTPEKDGAIDRRKIERSVRDYIERYCQELNLSASDQEHLIDLVADFREANLKVRSASAGGVSAPELTQSVKKMKTSMDEFRKMTETPSRTIFGAGTPTTLFGDEPTTAGEDSFEMLPAD